jgi:glycosyltransferase involved in cell wall biosynthesis
MTGHDILGAVVNHCRADVILAICDPWIVYPPDAWRYGHDAKLVFWMPIQAEPVHPHMKEVAAIADAVLVYSRWGTDVAYAAGINALYMPLGVGPAYVPQDRAESRQMVTEMTGIDLSDKRLFGMVAANSSTIPISRKAFDKVLLAFRRYQDEVGDGVLWLHAHLGNDRGGVNIYEMINGLDLKLGGDIIAPDPLALRMGVSDASMAKLYSAFDVALQATTAEGFGLPIIEAQACGTPVIVTAYGPQAELLRHGDYVTGDPCWIPGAPGGIGHVPNAESLVNAMGGPGRQRGDGSDIRNEYNWDDIVPRLVAALEAVTAN